MVKKEHKHEDIKALVVVMTIDFVIFAAIFVWYWIKAYK